MFLAKMYRILVFLGFLVLVQGAVDESRFEYDKELQFSTFTEEDFNRLLEWTPPIEIQKDYAYFLSGYDDDGVPIWVAEMGKWDPRKSAEAGKERVRSWKLYMIQFLARCIQSAKWNSTEEDPKSEFNLIIDMEGYSSRQISSPQALELQLWGSRQYANAFVFLRHGVVVNGNFVFTTFWDLVKPILGSLTYRVSIFGTNKNRWVPDLLNKFPKDQLPDWLGGSDKHVPVLIYG